MGMLIQSKATRSINSRQLLGVHPAEVISSGQIFEGQISLEEYISSAPNKKFTVWLKVKFWCWFISPTFLLISIFFYTCAPSKVTHKELSIAFSKYLNIHFKRILDIVGAGIGLILSSVLFLILPILIKLDSKGPVFYTQIRVGQNRRRNYRRTIPAAISQDRRNGDRRKEDSYGKLFVIYKFRTMRDEAEKKCGPIWASDNDPRITPIGRILRYTHLDELPQLLNILKGDMSFVGPRPERPYFVNKLAAEIPGYTERLKVQPGLTGLAQLKSGYDYSLESVKQKLIYDLQYCQNGNLGSYLKIMLLTLARFMTRKLSI
jgi:lipopolysaccharide/colanic/teichoic acid biosynthesis glycosyltransferase